MHVIDEGTTYLIGEGEKITFMKPPAHGGTTNEELIEVLIHRINWLNVGEWRCQENAEALAYLAGALQVLNERQARVSQPKLEKVEEVLPPNPEPSDLKHISDNFKVERAT